METMNEDALVSSQFEACAEFCERYDQASFDPAYGSEPVDFFEPMVRRIFAEPIYLPTDGNW